MLRDLYKLLILSLFTKQCTWWDMVYSGIATWAIVESNWLAYGVTIGLGVVVAQIGTCKATRLLDAEKLKGK